MSRVTFRIPAMVFWLATLWVALWGSITAANVLGGLIVGTGVVLFARLDSRPLRRTFFRPLWAIRYLLTVVLQLLVSNLRLAWEVLTPGDGTHTAILAVPIRGGSNAVVNLVANSITLTPGTLTLDVKNNDASGVAVDYDVSDDGSPSTTSRVTLYVHSMYAADLEAVRHKILELEALALRAFGSVDDYERAALDVEEHIAATKRPSEDS